MTEVITLKDLMKKDEKRLKIIWKSDKTHISAYKGDHKSGFYHIPKKRCLTKEEQFDWISHVGEKNWVNNYEFKEAFIKALKSWNLWKI